MSAYNCRKLTHTDAPSCAEIKILKKKIEETMHYEYKLGFSFGLASWHVEDKQIPFYPSTCIQSSGISGVYFQLV